MKKLFLLSWVALVMAACTKKPDPVIDTTAKSTGFELRFDNYVNSEALVFDKYYLNENKDSFKISAFKYYISNISLTNTTGEEYTESESYHLINHAIDSSKSFILKNIAGGKYTKIKFLIGVDSARNVSGAQVGALDPTNAMFWDWNTGYVMAKIEGYSPQASIYPNNLAFHIGGYKQTTGVLRWVTLILPDVEYNQNKKTTIHIKADLAEWFRTPNLIKFSDFAMVTGLGSNAQKIADNYADMFSIDHID